MAVTTQTSDGGWKRTNRRELFGHPIPDHVAHVEVRNDHLLYEYQVGWITVKGEKHFMPLDKTDEGIKAVIVAMKLSC